MELFTTGLIQAIISGAILLFITKTVEANNAKTVRATEAEKKIVERELAAMTVKFVSMEQQHGQLTKEIQKLREKVAVLVQKHEDLQLRVFEVVNSLEAIKTGMPGNYGKVTVKP